MFSLSEATLACLALAVAGLLLSSDPAHAGTDQSQTTVEQGLGIVFFSPIGQSFTPTQNSLDFVTLAFDGIVGPTTAHVDIVSGAGLGGPVLGSSPIVTLTNYNYKLGGVGGATTTFTFASPVGLTAGNPYTLRLHVNSGDGFVDESFSNPYAGGQGYFGGKPASSDDLYFVEGTQGSIAPATVPEPSSLAVLGLGGLGLAGFVLKAKRSKARAQ